VKVGSTLSVSSRGSAIFADRHGRSWNPCRLSVRRQVIASRTVISCEASRD